MTVSLAAAFALFVLGAAMFLAEIWFQVWSTDTFFKLMATDGVLLAIAVVTAFVIRERRESQRLRDRKGLD
jgi:uncharacterized membrane protein YcjF (UPF0283 family)